MRDLEELKDLHREMQITLEVTPNVPKARAETWAQKLKTFVDTYEHGRPVVPRTVSEEDAYNKANK